LRTLGRQGGGPQGGPGRGDAIRRRREAKAKGAYDFRLTGRKYDTVRIVTIREMVEQGARLELPLPLDARKRAKKRLGGGAQAALMGAEE
jgi:hypothetical protein